VHRPDELRALLERWLAGLAFDSQLGNLEEPVRYALAGGKRIRGVLCLATAEAAGADVERTLPAAGALELVHAFSLVHDDLPALDDDAERRGRPSVWAQFGEATAVLTGDALLAEAFRLAAAYETPAVARELAAATLGMIGGQHLDLNGAAPDETLHRLKTGRLLSASVGSALAVAEVPEEAQASWRRFGDALGPLFQLVDDILDGDGAALVHGIEEARRRADAAAAAAAERLRAVPADTAMLGEIVEQLAARTV